MAASLPHFPLLSSKTTHHEAIIKHKSEIRLLENCKSIDELRQLHCHLTKIGLSHHPPAISKLITTCTDMATLPSSQHARKAFELFLQDEQTIGTVFMWNSLLRGFSLAGSFHEAILLFLEMTNKGVTPDNFTFPFVLSACARYGASSEGLQVHGLVVKLGFVDDRFISNCLIHFYGQLGEMGCAQKVFDEMCERNVVSWTSLICGYGRGDFPKEAVSLFFLMVEEGIQPNAVTMVSAISACAELGDLDAGKRVQAYIAESGVKLNTVMVNALVDMYMKCGANVAAVQLFEECVNRDLVLYNTILSNYARQGLAKETYMVLNEMLREGQWPDRVTMLSAILASSQLGDTRCGKCCHGYVLRNGFEGSDNVSNAMIGMYMKCGEQKLACRVFDLMLNKTVVSWNSLIAGFIRNGDVESALDTFNMMPCKNLVSWNTILGALLHESLFEEAIEVFRMMQGEGIEADAMTMVSVASACGYLGTLDLAKWAHAYIGKFRIPCDLQLGTVLVDMYARCGDPQSAMQVFGKMKDKDVTAWTSAIGAMAMEGNGESALELFDQMVLQGVKPDGVTFVMVLTACSHSGLVEQGMHLFFSMKEVYGISPEIVHYGCAVDLLGRAGMLGEAQDLIKSMPLEPNDVVWGALLAACRTYKNVDLAAYAAERITELSPEKSGPHVLLSNIYASAGKWNEVARVRLGLKERGVQKAAGSSSLEINGTVHEFTSGVESHPKMGDISLMLDQMNSTFVEAGYTPDLANVLLDVDEQEKKHLLGRHSEKLALAFGLISTAEGITIRIVKNLRMCPDCHSFAKLASKIYNREIVIRDNNRFHFFREGLCSCHDYWSVQLPVQYEICSEKEYHLIT
ncbi:Pentatricopeptide repeat-containing protein At3g22690 [Ancistrocladus abbreviatus]